MRRQLLSWRNTVTPYRGNRFDYAHYKKECKFFIDLLRRASARREGFFKWQDF